MIRHVFPRYLRTDVVSENGGLFVQHVMQCFISRFTGAYACVRDIFMSCDYHGL